MPRLSQVRFVNVGHPNARFEDVTLDLRDPSGNATDTILWLRNGGGKSSLLNLLFAVIRTDRRDFLGGRAESRQRVLEDYILPTDRGVVVTEWELDTASDTLELGEKTRFVAGVFYEHRQDQERSLRRLFFAGRIIPGMPETTIEGLPLLQRDEHGVTRRTLHGFREAWAKAAADSGDSLAITTETQREWYAALDRAGIDPDLFRYQLRMNLREGGADELFRFSSDEDFVDFLLELTVDPSHSEDVGKNIEAFREQLRRRQHEYMPELEFCAGLADRLMPFAEIQQRAAEFGSRNALLHAHARQEQHALLAVSNAREQRLVDVTHQLRVLADEEEHLRRQRQTLQRERTAWLYHAASTKQQELAEALHEVEAQEAAVQREVALLTALQHHLAALRWEREAAAYAQERAVRHEALRPDKERADAAAAALARALDQRLEAVAVRQAAVDSTRTEARNAVDTLRKEEIDVASQLRALESQAKHRAGTIASLEAGMRRLVEDGVLRSGESASDALEIVDAQRDEQYALRQRLDDERTQRRARIDDLVREEAALRASVGVLQNQRARLEADRTAADAAWMRLAQNPDVLRRMEAETLTREELGSQALDLFERAAAVLRQRALTARARRADLERDAESLRRDGLLAPDPDVERVLAQLDARFQARSGWQDIAGRGLQREDADTRLTRHPELARGVIVEEGTLDAAVAAIAALTLDFPIVVADARAWEEPAGAHQRVVRSSHAARYDRNAGHRALEALEERAKDIERDARRDEEELQRVLHVIDTHRSLLARHSAAWFAETLQAIDALRDEENDTLAAVDACLLTSTTLRDEDERAHDRREILDTQLRTLERRAAQLEALGDAPQRLRLLQDEQAEEEGADAAFRERLEAIARRKLRADLAVDEAEQQREQGRDEHRRLAHERETIGEFDAALIPPDDATSLEDLRAAWRAARAHFEDAVGDDGLGQMERHAEEQASRERQRRRRALDAGVSIEEVEARAKSVQDPDAMEDALQVARERLTRAAVRRGEADADLRRAIEEHRTSSAQYEAAHRPDVPDANASAADARRHAHRCDAELLALEQRKPARDEEAFRWREEQAAFVHQAEREALVVQRLTKIVQATADPDGEPVDAGTVAPAAPKDLDEIVRAIDGMDAQLLAMAERLQSVAGLRKEALRAVRSWCLDVRFETVRGEVATRFRRMDDAQLEADAVAFHQQLRTRCTQLEAAISELDRHRRTLAQLVLQLALEGVRQLEIAANVSMMPKHVPEFGGERFLEIRMQVPQDPAWRTEAIGQLLDEVVSHDEVPTGIELVQLAVRRLAGPLRVRVLNPNPASHQRRIPVTETAKFSGGEQLTSAILLFCTLANVRARNRGLAAQPSSVLILDNPIGRASRRRFLEMQLAFARAMNVQLIYTTAVNDAEALSVMPNLIRLTNERVDARRGHRLVEANRSSVQEVVGTVSTTRITRSETAPVAGDGQTNDAAQQVALTESDGSDAARATDDATPRG